MKAAVYTKKMLAIRDVEKPVPKEDEVLIKVRAASVNPLAGGPPFAPWRKVATQAAPPGADLRCASPLTATSALQFPR